jgi:type I restriction enzyme M protein
MFTLKPTGKAAIVVPTGFITAQSGIGKKIRQKLVKEKMLAGVVTMPSNIFATTGTNVSVLFIDKENKDDVILIDASNLGETIKEDGNQKTILTFEEEEHIIKTFTTKEVVEDFSVLLSYDEIKTKNYSLSAGQYFEVKIEYLDISQDEFSEKMKGFESNLQLLFDESRNLETEIKSNIDNIEFDNEST